MIRTIARGRGLAACPRRFVRRRQGGMRVLVVGDSSGVGVGASSPVYSVAGRLAAAHPDWSIGNLAVVGSRTADVARLVSRLRRRTAPRTVAGHSYDMLIVHTGGNDALHATPSPELEESVDRLVAAACLVARHTVIVTGGNLALAPALPVPWSWWFGAQSRRVRDVLRWRIPGSHVVYVDLYRKPDADPTVHEPERFFARDGLHPSDENYALWSHAIDQHVPAVPGRAYEAMLRA
jgi:lysophospholipase L1-like esterase